MYQVSVLFSSPTFFPSKSSFAGEMAELQQLLNHPNIPCRRRTSASLLLSNPNKNFLRQPLPPSTAAFRRHQIHLKHHNPLLFTSSPSRIKRNPSPIQAFDSTETEVVTADSNDVAAVVAPAAATKDEFPGEGGPAFEIRNKEVKGWEKLLLNLRLLVAPPWQRVANGSVLCISLGGTISDVKGRWLSTELALPELCENFAKAANDPRISGILLKFNLINCGWAKLDEIRRHILEFRNSGKFVVGYMFGFREKEYYLACACDELYAPAFAPFSLYGFTLHSVFLRGIYEKLGLEPQWIRIGKYKKFGDQITRKNIAEPHLEVLNNLLDGRYENWVQTVSSATGKTREELESFINEGVYEMERVKEEGLITDILYEDEVMSMLKARLGIPKEKDLPTVDYKSYSKVMNWTLGLNSGEDAIAVIRASGLVVEKWGLLSMPGSVITPDIIKKQFRIIRESKKYKAVIFRIDCCSGEPLASDLIWKEMRLLAKEKPVIASLSDMAASGGYYIAMGANAIVAEKLSVAASIGIIQGKMNYSELHQRIGLNKHVVSKGRFAEFPTCEHRSLRPDEKALLENQTMYWYKMYRDKAALSRSMSIEDMEKVAQGRVWSGEDAVSNGLVDAVGGMARAIAIAKHKANIPLDKPVKIVELSKPTSGLPAFLETLGSTTVGLGRALAMAPTYSGAQARFDAGDFNDPIFAIMKYFLEFSQTGAPQGSMNELL
ncbi:Serine protease SPPA, chloroplastic [Linum grandiflorum]